MYRFKGKLLTIFFITAAVAGCQNKLTKSEKLMNRGVTMLEKGKFEKGLLYLNRSISADSANLDAYLNRGCAYDDLEKYQESLNDYQFLFAKGYRKPALFYNTGLTYYGLKEFEKSVEMFDSAIALEPHVDFYIARGTSLSDLNRTEEAIGAYNQAYAITPNDKILLFDFGYTYYIMKDYEKAEWYLKEAVSKGSKDEYVYLYLSKVYQAKGLPDEACKYYKKALRMQPMDEEFADEDKLNCN